MNPDSPLKTIRITIIDNETIAPFKLEFIERYKLENDKFYKAD